MGKLQHIIVIYIWNICHFLEYIHTYIWNICNFILRHSLVYGISVQMAESMKLQTQGHHIGIGYVRDFAERKPLLLTLIFPQSTVDSAVFLYKGETAA